MIPFFFWSIFNGIYVHTFKFVCKLWNAYQNGTKTMNVHWKLIFSLKCLTMYFLKSFLKNETSNMPFVSKSQDQCSFSSSPTLLFWTTFDWYQPLKTKKKQLSKDIFHNEPQPQKIVICDFQPLLHIFRHFWKQGGCVATEQQHCNPHHGVFAGSGSEIACFRELHNSSDQ